MISRRAMMNDEIVSKSGELLQLEKCKGSYLNGLRVFGASNQMKTTGAQLLNPILYDANKTENGVTFETQPDGSILISGKSTGTSTFYFGEYIDLLEDGKSYTYKSESPAGTLIIAYNDGTADGYFNKITVDKSRMVSIKPYIQFDINKPLNGEKHIFPILNEGTVVKQWEPYTGGKPSPSPEYPQEIANVGDDGQIECVVNGRNLLIPNRNVYKKMFLKAGTTLTLQKKDGVESSGGNVLFTSANGENVWFSIDKGEAYVTHKISQDVIGYKNVLNGDIEYCLSIGELTRYESYKEQAVILQTPNGLPGIPVSSGGNYTDSTGQQWVCDEIDLERGKYVQRIYKCKKEDLTIVKWSNNEYFIIALDVPTPNTVKALCSITSTYSSSWTNTDASHYFLQEKYQKVIIALGKKYCNSMEEMQKVLDAGIDFRYILKEPIEHDLPPEVIAAYKTVHTYAGTTVIMNDENVGMEVSYRKVRG